MDGPQTRRKCAQLNSFDAALFDERDRILEVVVCVLGAVGCENSAWGHWFAIKGVNHAQLVSTDFDQRHLPYDLFERELDQVQSWLEYICLNADFAFRCDNSSGRHLCSEVSPFLDSDLRRSNIHEDPSNEDEQKDEK